MHDSLLTKRNQWGLKVCVRWNVDTGFTLFTWQCVLWALLNGVCSSRYIFFMFFWAPKVMFIPYERPSNLHFKIIYCTNPALQEENFHLKNFVYPISFWLKSQKDYFFWKKNKIKVYLQARNWNSYSQSWSIRLIIFSFVLLSASILGKSDLNAKFESSVK